ncbi:flagellar motor protein MotB [Diaminobutyricimonas sp. TR449]|uniref:OmpA/MotB family protein n=1 Tax=Diaminobutyricimonas sp. TR449 TaxID=2708076 RepID=UPI0014244F00|nr:flagellar motor protein MotB [Diaminobutyricimonas sp. TR449]
MSARRRRSLAHEDEGHDGPDERWMASYMDMVTVIMCLFIVLFAMSTVDQKKFEQLRDSLATGFGVESSDTIDTAEGIIVEPQRVGEEGALTDLQLARLEVNNLHALQEQLTDALTAQGLQHAVAFELTDRGLTVRLVGSETYFESNRAELIGIAPQVLNAIAPTLAATTYELSVEGHADHRASGFPYPTNWELSSARSTSVLRHLVESGGIAKNRIASVGFGDSRPEAGGSSPEELALNRRVDIMVLSAQPETVRELFATVQAEISAVG